jgi:molybdopterin synthase sulfur carrier subunit
LEAGLVSTLGQLLQFIVEQNEPVFAEVLLAPNVLMAQNHEMVDADAVLSDNDEIAFFPPVTGG